MKKLLLILLCLPMIGFGQTWRYSSGGNDFDGKYRTSSIVGTGDDYPYNSPRLVINYFEKLQKINFYISDAGYYTSSSNTEVMLSFNNEKGVIYKPNSLGYSSDRKSVFLESYFSPNNVRQFEIFQKLMDASYVNIRIKNNYGQNDMRFSLRGSTKAIKYVIPYDKILETDLKVENILSNMIVIDENYLNSISYPQEHIPQFVRIERIDGVRGFERNEGVYSHRPYKYNKYIYTKIDGVFSVYWYLDEDNTQGNWRTISRATYSHCGLIDNIGNRNPELGTGLQYPGMGKTTEKFDGDKISRSNEWRMTFFDVNDEAKEETIKTID